MIETAPDDFVRRLERHAARELMAIIEAALPEVPPMTPREVFDEVRKLGLRQHSGSAAMIRSDRDLDNANFSPAKRFDAFLTRQGTMERR